MYDSCKVFNWDVVEMIMKYFGNLVFEIKIWDIVVLVEVFV